MYSQRNNDFALGSRLKDIDYPRNIKRKADEKGSKSARRITARSIGGDKSKNPNEFSSLKCGKTDRTIKSYREKFNKRESYNDNFEDPTGYKDKESKIRYK